ncbi:hypothetical protein [Leisingera aquimarina]|uniref:hypothetical protein n=1 Tax=Leisingera aquimarina TaxID=476529 RepID=UPI00042099DE|nr:hypothetical protein [Leisingera aquimarina]
MVAELETVNFFRPVWRAYNCEAKEWVADTLTQVGVVSPSQREQDAMASFLYTGRWCLQANRLLACPKVKDFWSKFPLVGWAIVQRLASRLQGKFLRYVQGTGVWSHGIDDEGNSFSSKVTTLYEVDQSLQHSPLYDGAQFIDVGRPQLLISEKETRAQRESRKARGKSSPKLGVRKAERKFCKPYHLLNEEVEELNRYYQKHPLQLPDQGSAQAFCGSVGRVFHGERLDAGGRFYGAYTGLEGDHRLHCKIDGEPIVQIDLNAAQAVLFSSLMGYKIKDTGRENGAWSDLYGHMADEIYGEGTKQAAQERSVIKAVGVELIGCGNPCKAKPSQELQFKHGVDESVFKIYRDKILEWVPALKHLDRDYYNGAGFITYHESQIVLRTIQQLHNRGIPGYPMHDCLIVKSSDKVAGLNVLREVANSYILEHCRTHDRPEEISVMVACSLEEPSGKIRIKGYYL